MDDASPRPRRSQAERSETMRRRLLDAAKAVLGDKGLSGFRTQEVIERAGVSKGALIHHFPTKDELIVAVFEDLYAGSHGEPREPRAGANLAEVIDDLIADSHAFFFGESFDVSLNITVAAARDPELKEAIFAVVRRFRKNTEEVWIERLGRFGIPPQQALDAVWLINSMIRGFAVRALWEPDQARFKALEKLAAKLVLQHISADQ
jgi:AcrR family transcriptional regulator